MKKVFAAVFLLILGVVGRIDAVKGFVVPTGLCVGSTTSMTDTVATGVWTSGNTAIATVDGDGVVTGISGGSVVVTYMLDTTVVLFTLTVDTALSPIMVVDSLLCAGDSVWVSGLPTGGSWLSKNTSVAVFTDYGMTAVAAGIDTVLYSVGNTCGTFSAQHIVTVNVSPQPITLPAGVCWGDTVTAGDAVPGGTWTTDYGYAVAEGSDGIVGVTPGTETVTYTLPGGCFTTAQLIVARPPSAITGDTAVCTHSVIELGDSSTTGTWSSSDDGILRATAGYVLGIAEGTAVVSYNDTNACGTFAETFNVTVLASPAAITIDPLLCIGTTYVATDSVSGGSWSAAYGLVSVDADGAVSPISIGSDVIRYTGSNGCSITKGITISAVPSKILGDTIVCLGFPGTFEDSLTDGIWSISAGSAATITGSLATATLTGTDTGVVEVAYTNLCGTADIGVTVATAPRAGTITGESTLCQGATTSLEDSVGGGVWESRFDSVATIGATGTVSGISGGITLIVYRVENACGSDSTALVVTVNPKPTAGTITGPDTSCVLAELVLEDTTSAYVTGSVWGVTNARLSIISEGTFYGAAPGYDTVFYKVTNSCGSDSVAHAVYIKMYPIVAAVAGTPVFCAGSTVTFSDATPGGTWSATNLTSLMLTGGIATAVTGGTDTILYSVTNSCATVSAKYPVTINPLPMPGIITFPDSICPGVPTLLTESAIGGSWTDFNGNIMLSADTATGNVPGIDTIYYTVSNLCGTEIAHKAVFVKSPAHAAGVTGVDSVCIGSFTTLSDSTTGGIWWVSNPNATMSNGIVTGVSVGYDTAYYVVSGCGTDTASLVIETLTRPTVADITGNDSLCIGGSVTLGDASPNGVWSIDGSALMLSGNIITGHAVGIDTVNYTVSNVCGSTRNRLVVAVLTAPDPSITLPASSVCVGHMLIAAGTPAGGTWALTNSVMSLSGNTVTASSFGIDTLVYTVTNICATAHTSATITTDTVLTPYVAGVDYVCIGASDTINALPAGGTWNIANSSASINDGMLQGLESGLDTVYYSVSNSCGIVQTSFPITVFTKDQCDSINGVRIVADYIEGVTLYPNPAKDYIVAEGIAFGTNNLDVKFIDLLGNLVSSATVAVNAGGYFRMETKLPKNIADGVYMLRIATGTHRQTFPVTVQH